MNKLLASYFTPQQTIILIVVSVLGVLLIILNIVLAYIFHKRGERKLFSKILQQQREMYLQQLNEMRANPNFSEDKTPYKPFFNMGPAPVTLEPQEQPVEEETEENILVDEDQDIVDEVVVNGIVIRYNRSFTARIIQASDDLKARYSELKNYILSYKGVKNKISWKKETFRHGRSTLITFVVRGKTLCMCLAMDPKQFEDSKYKVNDLSVRSPKSKTPCMYRISNERRVKYAKELIDMLLAEDYLLQKIERNSEDFMPPYETTEALINRDLIRIIGDSKSLNIKSEETTELEEEVIDTPIEETLIEEVEEELPLEELEEDSELTEETTINGIIVRYNRSFIARLSQASDELNSRYTELKNYMLSFKGVKNRVSWKKETFHQGRNTLATFVVRGKTLCLCLAMDPKQFEDSKYKVNDLSVRSPKSKTPCMYRISNDRRVKYAKELIDILFGETFNLLRIDHVFEDFTVPYETTEVLIQRGLIRVLENDAKESKLIVKETEEPVEEEETKVEELDEEVESIEETTINGIVIRYNRSFTARLSQATDELNSWYSELKNYILSFKGVKNRVSWKKETFHQGRNTLATFVVRGKSLRLCLAMDPKQFEDSKYKVIDLSIRSPKSKTPCMYRISSNRRVKYAKELIDLLLKETYQLNFQENENIDYSVPYETTEILIERDLIRIIGKEKAGDVIVETPVEEAVEEETVVETPVEEPIEEETVVETLVEEPIEEEIVVETPVEEAVEEIVVETAAEEPVEEETVVETLVEEAIEEETVVETPVEEPVEEETVVETPVEETVEEETVVETVAEEPVEEETVVETLVEEAIEEETVVETPVEEAVDEETDDVEEIEINGQVVRYNRSYLAAIAQVSEETKKIYSELKNYLLTYKGVKCRTNWKRESFSLGGNAFACFIIRNKTLCLCLATDASRFKDTQYKVIDLSLHSSRSKMPCMYHVLDTYHLQLAKEMIQLFLTEKKVESSFKEKTDYSMPYESTEVLIGKGLIRVSVLSKNK